MAKNPEELVAKFVAMTEKGLGHDEAKQHKKAARAYTRALDQASMLQEPAIWDQLFVKDREQVTTYVRAMHGRLAKMAEAGVIKAPAQAQPEPAVADVQYMDASTYEPSVAKLTPHEQRGFSLTNALAASRLAETMSEVAAATASAAEIDAAAAGAGADDMTESEIRECIRAAGVDPDTGVDMAAAATAAARARAAARTRTPVTSSASARPSAPRHSAGGAAPSKMADQVRAAIAASPECAGLGAEAVDGVMQTLVLPRTGDGDPWATVIGQEDAKRALTLAIVQPVRRPDLFTGIRAPPSGVLLFGPPGNGKTLVAKAVATACDVPFFSISASSLVSKYLGEGEQRMAALFAVARACAPCVLWIDEVDSILTARGGSEHDAMRRLKTEFLVQVDGLQAAGATVTARPLVLAATNRPQDIDTAALRRFHRRIAMSPPSAADRAKILQFQLARLEPAPALSDSDYTALGAATDGYSAADLAQVCSVAAMAPLQKIDIETARPEDVAPVTFGDVQAAISHVRPSLSADQLEELNEWAKEHASTV